MTPIKTPKKLIEVALPLDAINTASAKEKSIRHGHPSTLHLWWARRPLAAARAVIFAQLVNDPGGERGYFAGMTKAQAALKREELFKIVEDLVHWENTNNEEVLARARAAIRESWIETCRMNKSHPLSHELFDPERLPPFHDPFAGGGALPLEAQRLGLESFASDLNPVAVTINKAMIEIPPLFAGLPPVGPPMASDRQGKLDQDWSGAKGLAEDVHRYGAWMRAEAARRLGHLYPQVEVTSQMAERRPDLKALVGQRLTVIAYLWARTVKSPNPAFNDVDVPLTTTFTLSSKEGKEGAYVRPILDGRTYSFEVVSGVSDEATSNGTKASGRGANFLCLMSGTPIGGDYIKAEGQAGRMGARLMALVADSSRGRVYLSPDSEQEATAKGVAATWRPGGEVPARLTGGTCVPYGLKEWGDLFTARQLLALTTLSELVQEAMTKCRNDAIAAGMSDEETGLDAGGRGARAYSEAIGVYLAFAIDKVTDSCSSLCAWQTKMDRLRSTFGRQALPMVWDFTETNPLGGAAGDVFGTVHAIWEVLIKMADRGQGHALLADGKTQQISANKVVSTDPPYYDNIGYADLSDFFYVWLRRNLRQVYPNLFATLAVPKADELVASSYRHGGKDEAEAFFLSGMTQAMHNLAEHAHPAFPVTIYYAFKQSETKGEAGTSSTGWETFLQAVLDAGFAITGTWPMRTELGHRMIGSGTNALASSIILVCRQRAIDAPTVGRRDFIRELNASLPEALLDMTRGGVNSPVAPVDLSQAIIGPGMAIFSKYGAVLEADGKSMTVRAALQLINRFLSEDDFDHDTQFCLAWFDHQGWSVGKYGEADVLARAKGTSVGGLAEAGVIESGASQVRLFRWREYPEDWSPENDRRPAIWELLHQLIRVLNSSSETDAGALLARMIAKAEPIRALAYRLYTLCERKGWAEDAMAYNELITSWQGIEAAANESGPSGTQIVMDI